MTFRKSFIVGVNCRHVNFGSSERRRGQDPVKQGRRHFVFACLLAKSTKVTAVDSAAENRLSPCAQIVHARPFFVPQLQRNTPPFPPIFSFVLLYCFTSSYW